MWLDLPTSQFMDQFERYCVNKKVYKPLPIILNKVFAVYLLPTYRVSSRSHEEIKRYKLTNINRPRG